MMAWTATGQAWNLLSLVVGLLASFGMVYGVRKASFCEPITQSICTSSDVVHHYTRTPIVLPVGSDRDGTGSIVYGTQKEAAAEMRKFRPLLHGARGCRGYLRPFLCSIYLPACSLSVEPDPPCRDLCERARHGCFRGMRHLGLTWTGVLDCERYPTPEENPSCISALTIGEVNVTSSDSAPMVRVPCTYDLSPLVHPQWLTPSGAPISEDPTQQVYLERTNKHTATLIVKEFIDTYHRGNYVCASRDWAFSRSISLDNIFEPVVASCETITIPYCVDQLTYTRTSLPNAVLHSSQVDVENFIKHILEPGNCSPHLAALICSYLLPKCDGNWVHHEVLPCRELCEKVFTDCDDFGFITGNEWLPPPCETLTYSWEGQYCYNGIEFGPAHFPDDWTFESIAMELECKTKPSSLETANITIPSGPSYGPSHHPIVDGVYRLRVHSLDDRTFKLTTQSFQRSLDAGTYTCSDGDFSKSIAVDDVPTACVPITMPQCVGHLSYSETQLPNVYNTRSQEQLEQQLAQFDRLLQSGCSPFANTLLCIPLLTRCGTRSDAPSVVVCREMCDMVESNCRQVLDILGMQEFSCEMFPYQADVACYNGVEIGPVQVNETTGGNRMTVECRFPATRPAEWLGPGSIPLVSDGRIDIEMLDSYTSRLTIDGFKAADSGVYTCTDGTFSQTFDTANVSLLQESNTSCIPIEDDACRDLLGYDMTWRPRFYNTDSALGMSLNLDYLLETQCSPYLPLLVCARRFPGCIQGAGQGRQAMCRTLCKKVEADCGEAATHLNVDLGCGVLPSQSDSGCFNGVTIGPVEYGEIFSATNVEVNCTSVLPTNKIPKWRKPDGTLLIATDPYSLSFTFNVELVAPKTAKLKISFFDQDLDEGEYACIVDGLEKSVVISKDQEQKGSCQPITESFCSEGVGYTHAYFPNLLGDRSVAEVAHRMRLYSSLRPVFCSPYARALICTTFFPPCDPDAEVPTPIYNSCRQLCEKNFDSCQGKNLHRVPDCSFYNTTSPCYDVDEISITHQDLTDDPSSYYMDCTYNLLPKYQPVWYLPNGEPVKSTDPASRRRVTQQSPTVTRLYIDDFANQQDAGTYTCSGPNSNKTVIVGSGDAAKQPEITLDLIQATVESYSRIIDCTYNLSPSHQPTWQNPDGENIPFDDTNNVHVSHMSDSVTRLFIAYFIPAWHAGTYTCVGLRDSVTVDLRGRF